MQAPHQPSGFTLIETFVAIAILATALAGTLSLAAEGFNSADIAGDQITSSFLAQDAMEYIRYSRDTACLGNTTGACISANNWLSKLSSCISVDPGHPNYCYLDSSLGVNVPPRSCGTSNPVACPPMHFDSTSSFYNYPDISNTTVGPDTNLPSKYIRAISIIAPAGGNANEAQITVLVYSPARGGGLRPPITLQEDILNWQ